MADLIIRGMDLGNTMSSCPFHADDGYGDDYCAAGHIDCHAPFDERPEDCPVTILKKGHGRLIDADALAAKLQEEALRHTIVGALNRMTLGGGEVIDRIKAAPTIVPAEGGTEDG